MQHPTFVILAGGIGKNFAPLVTNKSVFPFLGRPLIFHVLEMIEQAGARKAVVVCNQSNQALIQSYASRYLNITTVEQEQADGQAQALLLAAQHIASDEPIIVMNGVDLIEPTFLKQFVKKTKGSYGRIVGMRVQEYFNGGYLKTEGKRVVKIIEKPKPGTEPSDLANLLVHYFSQPQDLFSLLKQAGEADDAYEQAMTQLMHTAVIDYELYESYWQKLKQAHQVLDMTQLLLKHKVRRSISRQAFIHRQAMIEGAVHIEAGARIEAGAVIKGPAYIGKNVIVGNHSLVRNSIVEADSIIGFGSEVARSYIGPNCSLHHNFIGDSVLEGQVNPSYGTCTANLRFDGQAVKMRMATQGKDSLIDTTKTKLGAIMAQGVFLGINCSILPGITIGTKATTYPGSVINQSIPAYGSFGT